MITPRSDTQRPDAISTNAGSGFTPERAWIVGYRGPTFRANTTSRSCGRCRMFLTTAVTQSWKSVTFRSEEHTSELQSHSDLVCRLLLEKNNKWACVTFV